MLKANELKEGVCVASPAGRFLKVKDIFVPKNEQCKSKALPTQFRQLGRKIVVFHNGCIAPLAEITKRYHVVDAVVA